MDNHDKKNFTILSSIIKNEDVCIDVGANIGLYSKFFLGLGARVYSIELDPQTCEQLKTDDIKHTIINAAISDIDGEIVFFKGEDSCRNNIIGHDMNFSANPIAGKIRSHKLDSLFADNTKIKLLKIDIEGAELDALRGASNMISNVEYMLLECHLDRDWNNIRELLNNYGFKCVNLETDEEITSNSKRPYQCFCQKI